MIPNNHKTSILIPEELPGFIRDNESYQNFTLFLQAYYEWLEENNNVSDRAQNILNYTDIDKTTNEFLQYFINDFLPYFPDDALIDKRRAVKIAKQLYQAKGTPASYKFLFKILYNSDFDIFYTKDFVLRASDGSWTTFKTVRLSTLDSNFLNIKNYRLFGEESKSFATIENSIRSGTKTEVFLSDIERLFTSGEFVRVVDNNNKDVYFLNGVAVEKNINGNYPAGAEILRAKIVGQISQIRIDSNNRGLFYVPGDPVIVYGGLSANTGNGATAEVGTTTTGSIQRINVLTGGFGYQENPNTIINITNASLATAIVGSVDADPTKTANVSFVTGNTIGIAATTQIGNTQYSFFINNPTANANTRLINALSFIAFSTYPISSVFVTNGGGGISQTPQVSALERYATNSGFSDLSNLGILGPIQIANAGKGYVANDIIVITGGSGYGAYANVTSVSANGAITSVRYVHRSNVVNYPLGGLGYRNDSLPTLNVISSNVLASNASLFVPMILGTGATFSTVTNRAGSISTINILNAGEDYIESPNVSLRVMDILTSNASLLTLPQRLDICYQGSNPNTATFSSLVDSIDLVVRDNNPLNSLYSLRVFEYTSTPNPNLPLKFETAPSFVMANVAYTDSNYSFDSNGLKIYGDGRALATASFLNGLNISQGQYIDSRGQPSGYSVLESDNYNNFTYKITVQKEIAKYRDILLNLLHPTGLKLLGRYALSSNSAFDLQSQSAVYQGEPLQFYTNYPPSNVTMVGSFINKSNNIIRFNNLAGAELNNFIFSNSIIEITTQNGLNVRSSIASVDNVANTVTLNTWTWLTFSNVATIQANANSNLINILTITDAYDIINNGYYSNTRNKLEDIVFSGDKILVANNTEKVVQSVNYATGVITLTSNLTTNARSLMAVNRSINSGNVVIYGPRGIQYFPQLATEDGRTLTTEDDLTLLLG
jgi:hypothetical protein